MAQVSNQMELESAIIAKDPDIQITASFTINATQAIEYTTTIHSGTGGPYTLTKADSFNFSIFSISKNGSLTLTNIILDGAKRSHPDAGISLIRLPSGTLILDNGAVLQNNRADDGGAISRFETGNSTIIMKGNSVIRNNEASSRGGGIYAFLSSGGSIQLSDQARIENNRSTGQGGGIYYASYDLISNLTVGNQAMIRSNISSNNGGGIFMSQGNCNIMENAILSNNSAENGGGLFLDGSSLLMENSAAVQNNTADNQGGGIYFNAIPNGIVIHGQISGNSAASGGGIHVNLPVNETTLNFSYARFIENQSIDEENGSGGGLNIMGDNTSSETLSILMENALFRRNEAIRNGSAVFISYHSNMPFELYAGNCQFTDNSTQKGNGCVCLSTYVSCSAQFQNCSFTGNQAGRGGGIYLLNSGSEQMRVQLIENIFTNNSAETNGGAVSLDGGNIDITLYHVTITECVASMAGGGLSSENSTGTITIANGSEITSTRAISGGGIYHADSTVLVLSDVTLSQNTASENGQDLYNTGILELKSLVHLQDGLYFNTLADTPVILSPLTADSFIQLENSDYVTPNPSGTPVVIAQSNTALTPEDADKFHLPASSKFVGWEVRVSDNGRQMILAPEVYTLQYENTKGMPNPNPPGYTIVTPTITLANLDDTPSSHFIGWFHAPEGGKQITEIPTGSLGSQTLYAQWTTACTLNYFPNDAGVFPAQYIPAPVLAEEGQNITLSSVIPIRKDYLFHEWNINSSGTGTSYKPGDTIPVVQINLELYAQWIFQPPFFDS